MANTYLQRTQGTATDRKKFTLSMWVKLSKTGSDQSSYQFCDFYNTANDRLSLYHDTNDKLNLYHEKQSGGSTVTFVSDMMLRDKSAWYHLVWRFDSTQSTATDRIKVYVNGEQITFGTYTFSEAQNYEFAQGTSSYTQYIGKYGGNTSNNFDGLMSHIHFCDGYSYGADSFGSTDSTTGEWKIKTSPSVTYGNNGFFILKDGNSVTDQSGNSNNFTVGGGTLTKTEDNPSNVFATLNGLNANNQPTLTNGNNTLSVGSGTWKISPSTLAVSSGKWYVEHKITVNNGFVGIGIIDTDDYANDTSINYCGENANSVMVYSSTGQKWINNTNSSYGDSYTVNDIIGIAMDLDNNKIYFSKNGTFMNSGDPTSGATGTGAIDIPTGGSGEFFILPSIYNATVQCNFGNGYFGTTAVSSAGTNASGIGIFEYDVPSGYTALSTKGLNL